MSFNITFPVVQVAAQQSNIRVKPKHWFVQFQQNHSDGTLKAILINDKNEKFVLSADQIERQKGFNQGKFLTWFQDCLKTYDVRRTVFPCMQIISDKGLPKLCLKMPSLGLKGGNPEDEDTELDYLVEKNQSSRVYQKTLDNFLKTYNFRLENDLPFKQNKVSANPLFERYQGPCELATGADLKIYKELLDTGAILSFKKYMQNALFNPEYGYYTSGKVSFTHSGIRGDFATHATLSNAFGSQIATQAAMMYISMRQSGDLKENELFIIHENAPGGGFLANAILEFSCKHFADAANPYLRQFWNALKYQAAEISPKLVEQAKEQNAFFIELGKFEVRESNAFKITETFKEPIKGLILSNELIDTFSLSPIRLNKRGEVEALTLAPCLELTKAQSLLESDFSNRLTIFDDETNITYVRLLAEDIACLSTKMCEIQWEHTYVPVELFPELVDFINEFGIPYPEDFQNGKLIFLNTKAPRYIKESSKLLSKGFLMTIDYALSGLQRLNPEIYLFSNGLINKASPLHPSTDLFSGMGQADITANIDFKTLIEAGKSCELTPLALVHQDNLSCVMPDLAAEPFYVTNHTHAGGFFALVQQKSTSAPFFIPAQSFIEDNLTNEARLYSLALCGFIEHANSKKVEEFKIFFDEISGGHKLEPSDEAIRFMLKIGKKVYRHSTQSEDPKLLKRCLKLLHHSSSIDPKDYSFIEAVIQELVMRKTNWLQS